MRNPDTAGGGERDVLVRVDNLTKKFADLLVLDGISFNVRRREFLCIVGPTGCGKTTFLNSLTKLYDITGGEILLDGEPVDLKRHNISYVFQEASTMPWLTVEDNVRFGLNLKRVPKAEADDRVDEVIKLVNLQKFRGYYPNQLSISMLQRVVIARAFVTRPTLLLMDEPYGQLDLELRYLLEDELIALWRRTRTTVVFITHNIEEAVYLGERILVLTNKPAGIKEEIVNDLPRPRSIADPKFVELRNRVTDLIKWW
ncbi:MAG: ABC transporter ATP-binding protein [Planctomycetota bacterium]|jgi:sulfonate transport system ATP-binding protein|nr:ABC transporter ATP-binding protein [Planctomycetota bacterium]